MDTTITNNDELKLIRKFYEKNKEKFINEKLKKKEKSWNEEFYGFPKPEFKRNINLFKFNFDFNKPISFNSFLEELNSIDESNKVLDNESLWFTITKTFELDCNIIIFKEHTYTKEECQKEKEDFIKEAGEEYEKLYPFDKFVEEFE